MASVSSGGGAESPLLGDRVRVLVDRVTVERRQIDFRLSEET